jgi:hypothetical protein
MKDSLTLKILQGNLVSALYEIEGINAELKIAVHQLFKLGHTHWVESNYPILYKEFTGVK